MIHAYHFFVSLSLMVLQTTVLKNIVFVSNFYDLLAPFVVYLAIHRRVHESLPVLLFSGIMMDGLSGGPFGLYLSAYLWLYFGVNQAIQFLHVGNVILLPLLVTLAVAFESLLLVFSAAILTTSGGRSPEEMMAIVAWQILWGGITGPLLLMLCVHGQKITERILTALSAEKDPLRLS